MSFRANQTNMADDWIGMDKLEHFGICFLIVILSALILRRTAMQRWSTSIACILSLTAGAAKEVGDQMGLWPSAGGSMKDAVADIVGVLLAAILLHFVKHKAAKPKPKPKPEGIPLHGSMMV